MFWVYQSIDKPKKGKNSIFHHSQQLSWIKMSINHGMHLAVEMA